MNGSAQPDDPLRSDPARLGSASSSPGLVAGPSQKLEEPELDAALQLLVERAQYITGATGTALALPHGDEMVCRASSGSSAPAIGARLQVRSGLTGESIARRQILRCDNAETDPRVNLETCHALGIASIVVLPLLRRSGEVRGLFELFSDHPYAFEERDLIALERMADLTLTALDLAEQRHGSVPPPPPAEQADAKRSEAKLPEVLQLETASAHEPAEPKVPLAKPDVMPQAPVVPITPVVSSQPVVSSGISTVVPEPRDAQAPELVPALDGLLAKPTPVPEAMRRVQKCADCGFPVSEGRMLCIDCERKELEKKRSEAKQAQLQSEKSAAEVGAGAAKTGEVKLDETLQTGASNADLGALVAPQEVLPPFLANAEPYKESWLANHVNLLAILVFIVGILVVYVVFR